MARALYIYYAQAGERIFDIAKRYHARQRNLWRQIGWIRMASPSGSGHGNSVSADSGGAVKEERL